MVRDNLLGQADVTLRTLGARIVQQRRPPVAGRLRQPDIPRNRGLTELLAEEPLQLRHDLLRQISALVEHGQDHALDGELWIEAAADAFHRIHQLTDTFQGEIFRLHRDQHRVGGNQGVEGEQIERGWAIEHNELVALPQEDKASRSRNSLRSASTSSILAPIMFLCAGTSHSCSISVGCTACSGRPHPSANDR